jgi:hypothetical protein
MEEETINSGKGTVSLSCGTSIGNEIMHPRKYLSISSRI